MSETAILETLRATSPNELDEDRDFRERAYTIVENGITDPSKLPETLLQLLTAIIKPIFTSSKHPALTSTGRKNLVPPAPSIERFNTNILDEPPKPWKNGWTIDLLKYILSTYSTLPESIRKQTLDAQFHLLIPPILNILDDIDNTYKAQGCQLLSRLSQALHITDSTMLSRTGLTEVFIDALRPNFLLLPTLTPEDESLLVLRELYPAFFSMATLPTPSPLSVSSKKKYDPVADFPTTTPQLKHLTLLLRHGVLASLSHLSAGQSTSYLPLTTFLVDQIPPIVSAMGITSVVHLQSLLPLLRTMLCDPFGAAAPDLLLASITATETITRICSIRIKEKWWPECLRGLVGCWCVVIDDEQDLRVERKVSDMQKLEKLQEVKTRLQQTAKMLGEIVEQDEWADARKQLLVEDGDLQDLFESSS